MKRNTETPRPDGSEKTSDQTRLELLNTLLNTLYPNLDTETMFDGLYRFAGTLFPGLLGMDIYMRDEIHRTPVRRFVNGDLPERFARTAGDPEAWPPEPVLTAGKSLMMAVPGRKKGGPPDFVYYGLPLGPPGAAAGVLGFYGRTEAGFPGPMRAIMEEMLPHVSRAVSHALDHQKATARTRRFVTISRAITVTRQLSSLDELLQDITKVLVQSMGFDQSWLGLVEETEGILTGKSGFGEGMGREQIEIVFPPDDRSLCPPAEAVRTRKAIYDSEPPARRSGVFAEWIERLGVRRYGFFPIVSGEHALGVIGVFYTGDQAFDQDDRKALTSVAEQAAIAIENARLYEQISTSEERYRTLFNAAGTSLVILDENLRFRLVNRAFEKLSGYKAEELVGKFELPAFLVGTPGKDRFGVTPQSWEDQFRDKQNVVKQVHITTTRIPESTDLLLSIIDMTLQRELERRLFRSEELAAIGELSAGIAHEIRNPLVAITTSVSLLKDEPDLSEEGRQLLDVVKEESDHLAAIVDDFLRFARPKKPSLAEEDINQILRDVVRRYRDWNERAVEWVEKYDDDLPPVPVDRHQLQQVITNLLINGLDAMPEGGTIVLETGREKTLNGEMVSVRVKDSGMGIPDEECAKIFQPFFSTKEKGTGMGLAICRRIMDDHNGEIMVRSRPGEGTTFTLYLPVGRGDVEI